MKQIIVATNNLEKLREIRQIITSYEIVSLKDIECPIEVEEDKYTFEENALKKAKEIARVTNKICIADDSGLCIDVLNGFPGVKTARFLGNEKTQEERNNYLLEKLKEVKKSKRTACVITCIALVEPNGKEKVFTGILQGRIAENKRGKNGFGFDEIFELENGKTLAEISLEEKNRISSRSIALKQLEKYLAKN